MASGFQIGITFDQQFYLQELVLQMYTQKEVYSK